LTNFNLTKWYSARGLWYPENSYWWILIWQLVWRLSKYHIKYHVNVSGYIVVVCIVYHRSLMSMDVCITITHRPVNIITIHNQTNVLFGIKYLVESTVVNINHHHLNKITSQQWCNITSTSACILTRHTLSWHFILYKMYTIFNTCKNMS